MRFCLAVLISGWHDGHDVLGLCKPRAKKKKKYKYNMVFFLILSINLFLVMDTFDWINKL